MGFCTEDDAEFITLQKRILDVVLEQLDVDSRKYDTETGFAIVNHACWSLGEIAVRQKQAIHLYVDRTLQKWSPHER